MDEGWIGVDLDGTLAIYEEWMGVDHIGAPIPLMVDRVKQWLDENKDVRIFTARVAFDQQGYTVEDIKAFIYDWCNEHIGVALPVTCSKDFGCIEIWDDRAIQIEKNTGRRVDGK